MGAWVRLDRYARRGRGTLRIDAHRIVTLAAAALYLLLLLWSLRTVISPAFDYAGYHFIMPSSHTFLALSISLAVLPAAFLPLRGDRPGNVILWILYVLVYVPAQVVPVFASGKGFADVFELQVMLLLGFFILFVSTSLPPIRMPRVNIPAWMFWTGVWAFAGVALLAAVATYGIPTSLPSLGSVYDVRSDFKEEGARASQIVLLLVNWQQKVINPLLIASGIVRRRPIALLGGVFGQLFLFGLNGQKSVFFSGLMVLAIVIAMRNRGRLLAPMVTLGAGGLVLLTGLLDLVNNSVLFSSLFVRRLILVPGILTGYYYEFFGMFPKTNLSQSILAPVFDYPYDLSIPRLIGAYYFNRPEMASNANIWADGYANFGIVGIIGFSIILGFVIWMFNSFALDRNLLVTAALAGMAAWSLSDTALFTTLRTHGLLFSILILFLMPLDKERSAVGPSDRTTAGTPRRRESKSST